MKPLSAPSAYLTHASLYPWYFAIVRAPTPFLLHQFPLNPHLKNEGKTDIASMLKTEPKSMRASLSKPKPTVCKTIQCIKHILITKYQTTLLNFIQLISRVKTMVPRVRWMQCTPSIHVVVKSLCMGKKLINFSRKKKPGKWVHTSFPLARFQIPIY